MKRRIVRSTSLLTVICMLVVLAAGCGGSSGQTSGSAQSSEVPVQSASSGAEAASAPSGEKPDGYPSGSIAAICPWTAGGSSDVTFRSYLQYVSNELGVDINVQNVTGGDGSIGMEQALSAPADGQTMAMLNYDILSNEVKGIADHTYRDFAIINMFTMQGVNLVVNSDSGWETFEDFRQAALDAKANGKTLQIGVNGFWLHAAGMMAEAAGISDCVVLVPSNGSSELVTELLGKHCDAVTSSMTVFLPHIEDGTVKVLGAMAEERMEEFPDIPTFPEMGYPSVVISGSRILAVHKDTPPEIVAYLREASKKAFDNPDFQEWAKNANADPLYMDAAETEAYLEGLLPTVEETMKKLGLV